jgi:hypothetical protein
VETPQHPNARYPLLGPGSVEARRIGEEMLAQIGNARMAAVLATPYVGRRGFRQRAPSTTMTTRQRTPRRYNEASFATPDEVVEENEARQETTVPANRHRRQHRRLTTGVDLDPRLSLEDAGPLVQSKLK